MQDDVGGLTKLGSNKTEYKSISPSSAMLETFPNRFPHRYYLIKHETKEFVSRCPKTGQPDFATVTVRYVADKSCIESKSLKLYFFAWQGEGSFMETICNRILEDLERSCRPVCIRVTCRFNARGGVETSAQAEYFKPDVIGDGVREELVRVLNSL